MWSPRKAGPHAIVVAAMFAFSLMALFTRGADAPILGVAAWRAVFVAMGFGIWTVLQDGTRALVPDRDTRNLGAALGVAVAVASASFVAGYAFTTVANTIFLHNLAPVVVFPLAWWAFQERPAPAVLTGAGIALVGVAMLSGVSLFQFSHFADSRFLLGDSMALLSAVAYGAVLVITRLTRIRETPILATLFVAWTVAAILLCGVALAAGSLAVPWRSLPWLIGLALICTNLPFYLLNLGMREVSAGMAAVLSLTEVLFATVLGIVVYSEALAPVGWLGGGLAAAGVLYAVTRREAANEPASVATGDTTGHALRAGVALVVLNLGALHALMVGSGAGALLSWIALALLLRHGAAALGPSPRLAGAVGAVVALLAAAALAGLVWRGGWTSPGASPLLLVAAAGAALLDHRIVRARPDQSADSLLSFALGALAAGQALALLGHRGGVWLSALAAAATALALLRLGVAVLTSRLYTRDLPLAELDALVLRVGPRNFAVALAVLFALGGLRAVPAGHVAVVERLGFPLPEPGAPGLLLRLPPPLERSTVVDISGVRRVPINAGGTPLLCGDESLVSVDAVVHFHVADALAFTFTPRDPAATLAALGRAALLQAVSRRTQDEVLTTGRGALEESVRQATQQAADAAGLGLSIDAVHFAHVGVPPAVMASFLDVISADEERQTAINEAEAHAESVLPLAGGEALALQARAHGEAADLMARAHGDAALLDALSQGGAAAPALDRERLWHEAAEQALAPARLVLAPDSNRVWLGGEPAPPRDDTPSPKRP